VDTAFLEDLLGQRLKFAGFPQASDGGGGGTLAPGGPSGV
jgi:hypothetical protein